MFYFLINIKMTGEEGYFEVVRKAAVECEDSELIDAI